MIRKKRDRKPLV